MDKSDRIFCSDDDFKDFLGEGFTDVNDKTTKGLIKEELAKQKSVLVTVSRYLGDTAKFSKIEKF